MPNALSGPATALFPIPQPKTARVGLIGVGGFGAYHLKFLSEMREQGLAELVAVADLPGDRLSQARADLGSQGISWYEGALDLITRESLDLIILCTPIHTHTALTMEALRCSTAAIYLEKPPAPTLEQLQLLIREDTANRVHVGFQMCLWQTFRQLKAWIREGRLGRLRRITAGAVWRRGDAYYSRSAWAGRMVTPQGEPVFDGPATNALAHLVHGIMHLASDGEAAAVPDLVRGEFYRARPLQAYDAACLSGRFHSGLEYTVAVAHCAEQEQDFIVRVTGDSGTTQISHNGRRLESDFATPLEVGDPYDATMHRETLLRLREGRLPVNTLPDCLGYSLATCGGLSSSGGIHSISPQYVRVSSGGVHEVAGMNRAVTTSIATGKMWSEQDLPWARAGSSTFPLLPVADAPWNFGELLRPTQVDASSLQPIGNVV